MCGRKRRFVIDRGGRLLNLRMLSRANCANREESKDVNVEDGRGIALSSDFELLWSGISQLAWG